MKQQSRVFVFCWISDLDFTPKMPVFHFLNLNNKYVFLLCIRWFALSWKPFDQIFFFTAHESSFIITQPYS